METYLAAAYWGPRREPVDACACRAGQFFISLSQVSEYLKGWRPLGRSRSEATQAVPIDLSTDALAELFMKGRNRRDVGGEVIDELGYRISVWNGGGDEEASSLTMKCGLYSAVAGLSNAIVLKLPSRFDTTSFDQVRQVATALAQAWNPDWAIIASRSALDLHADAGPFLDRALYVNSSMKVPDDIPKNSLKQELEHGHLFLPSM
ncbi:hypothetical protein PQR68_29830 [Paraburkholderia agricolaris]|uniref:Imm52 family immunity protein n=1 Tax=Paraburkholderia agricolaris TaxID=2152888 RepID=UPI001291ABB0|nr:Imm52 family immunity protein [Paraburkholderia agricolaris]MCP2089638.1 hypothetical protein [Paraburkholderia sediminicola]